MMPSFVGLHVGRAQHHPPLLRSGPVNWACLQLSCCWLGESASLVLLPSFRHVFDTFPSLPSSSEIPMLPFILLRFTEEGSRRQPSLPPPAPERTPIALQFSNPPGRQEVPGEPWASSRKDNLLLRQVLLGAATGPDGGRERVSWVGPLISDSTLFSKSRALDTHWELATARARLAGGTQERWLPLWGKERWASGTSPLLSTPASS